MNHRSAVGVVLFFLAAQPALASPEEDESRTYQTVYYNSGSLRIEAYLYRPPGQGPFPVVIYNHGSRAGHEREERPFGFVANMLAAQGYAVLVPERRGYGKSDGPSFAQEVGSDTDDKLVRRFHEEAQDVLAALDYLHSVPTLDLARVAIMGWSHGGVVSIIAASQNGSFRALIDQAGGALTWKRSAALRELMTTAARKIKSPALCLDSENDAAPEAASAVCAAIRAAGTPEKTIIYAPFKPTSNPGGVAPGHVIFSAPGLSLWQGDVVSFLKLRLTESGAPEKP